MLWLAARNARGAGGLRAALFDELTEDRLREVVRALIDAATEGDVSAARLVLQYSLGTRWSSTLQRIEDIEEAMTMRNLRTALDRLETECRTIETPPEITSDRGPR